MDTKSKIFTVLAKSIDLKGLATGLLEEVVEAALKKVVADSSNTFDDMAMTALYPVIEKEIKKMIEEKLDLEKLLGLKDAPTA